MDTQTLPPLQGLDILLILVFCIGYFLIAIEHITHINKATVALIMSVLCWAIAFANKNVPGENIQQNFIEHVSTSAQVVLFLLGALGIVETISSHKGFNIITKAINVNSPFVLFWLIGFITFFLSSVLDNLTTTIVMIALLQKIVTDREQRLIIGAGVVIAANAGGAWSPIGDVTTTMLWIGGNITSWPTMRDLFLPSIVCTIASFAWLQFYLPNTPITNAAKVEDDNLSKIGARLFFIGIGALIFVPVLRYLTGLPPFMGVMLGLGIMWLITDIIHRKQEDYQYLTMPAALSKVDFASCLFFLGILLSIQALEAQGVLAHLAQFLHTHIGNVNVIAIVIGIISAIIDNVPLVAGSMGLYDLSTYPPDSAFWQLIAFCAGTGGSMLIIGSAAGVAFMGLEKATFNWFLKKVTLPAMVGYFAGVGIYLMLS